MVFEELQRIWDNENKKVMYAIDETTLHSKISGKKTKIGRFVNMLELFMIWLNLCAGTFIFIKAMNDPDTNYFSYGIAAFMFIFAGYTFFLRSKRQREESRFDRTMAGDLDHAIAYSDYILQFAKKIIILYNLPIVILTFSKFTAGDVSWKRFVLLGGLFLLAYLLGIWEIRKFHLPRKKKLIQLRDSIFSGK